MSLAELEAQCELGQRLLMEMEYLEAERILADVESKAWAARAWDLLSRLYLPLQETRRQRRQRCGEGTVCLDLVARSASDQLDPRQLINEFPHGQLLVAGWGTLAPAARLRKLAFSGKLYVETFLAAVYLVEGKRVIVIAPNVDVRLPEPAVRMLDDLQRLEPAGCLIMGEGELPSARMPGTFETYALTMALWERLHTPFLARAEREANPIERMRLFRETIEVDYGCELAHQHLADVARQLRRQTGCHT